MSGGHAQRLLLFNVGREIFLVDCIPLKCSSDRCAIAETIVTVRLLEAVAARAIERFLA